MPGDERAPAVNLAQRLRDLRVAAGLNQKALASELGISVALISSWESRSATPPENRLRQYATYFADRSGDGRTGQRILLDELIYLRGRETASGTASGPTVGGIGGSWQFTPGPTITIITSRLSPGSLSQIPDAEDTSPDYVMAYKYGDLDALIELHGHIRAANPFTQVNIRAGHEVVSDDLANHIVVLGGSEYNDVMKNLIGRIDLPVTQIVDDGAPARGYFQVGEGATRQTFSPTMVGTGETARLVSDVALFYRAPNPTNARCTLTICNGMFARGTYGAVRALTDANFRDFNEQFIHTNFASDRPFSILSRVSVLNRQTLTPDWMSPAGLLHTWPE